MPEHVDVFAFHSVFVFNLSQSRMLWVTHCKSAIRLVHFLRYVVERLLGAVLNECYYSRWLAQAGGGMVAHKCFTLVHMTEEYA